MATTHPSPILSLINVVLTIVKPVQKTAHPRTIDPTPLDLIMQDVYIPTFGAYRLANKSDEAYLQLVNRIKESLGKVLIPFFPFAGRWISTLKDSSGRQLLCNDEGVPFIEAYVDKDLDSILWASGDVTEFQLVPELQGFGILGMDPSQRTVQMVPDGLPSTVVQMTRFKCGGVTLAVTWSHMLIDGKGFFDFMTAWSEISRMNETAVVPNHNRALTKSIRGVLETWSPLETSTPWVMKTFEVGRATIKSLKEEIKKTLRDDRAYVGTVDCVTAHMYRHVSMLPSSVREGREVSVAYTVDARIKLFDPPLPNLCGNVFTTVECPKIPSITLLESPLSFIAHTIRNEHLATNRETWLSLARESETNEPRARSESVGWVISSLFGFPMYEIDFGVGRPFYASSPNNTLSSTSNFLGMSMIAPPVPGRRSSAATLYVWSTPEVLEALQPLPSFLPFFQHDQRSKL